MQYSTYKIPRRAVPRPARGLGAIPGGPAAGDKAGQRRRARIHGKLDFRKEGSAGRSARTRSPRHTVAWTMILQAGARAPNAGGGRVTTVGCANGAVRGR